MITWMLHHENVRDKEQSQSSVGWTAQYPLSTFTHFSFLSVLFWSATNTLRLQAILDVSMSFPFLLLQSQLDPAGTSHNRPQLSMAGVSVYFLFQRLLLPDGSCYLFISAVSNALLLTLYTMFLGFWHLFLLLLDNISFASCKEQSFPLRWHFFCTLHFFFFEILFQF